MTKAKSKKEQNILAKSLAEGEEILWQGKPHATWSEYMRGFSANSSDEYKIWYYIPVFLGFIFGMMTMQFLSSLINFSLPPLLDWQMDILGFFAVLIFVVISVLWGILWLFPLNWILYRFIWFNHQEIVRYLITDKHLFVVKNSNTLDDLSLISVRGAIIKDTKHGASITWLAAAEKKSPIDQFIGLSDFDISHVLNLVSERSMFDMKIDDCRAEN